MWLRRLHRWVGLVFAPFFLITAITGGMLLWRRQVRMPNRTLRAWHNWEGLADYVGVLLAGALAFMAITGIWLWAQILWRRSRRIRRAGQAPAA